MSSPAWSVTRPRDGGYEHLTRRGCRTLQQPSLRASPGLTARPFWAIMLPRGSVARPGKKEAMDENEFDANRCSWIVRALRFGLCLLAVLVVCGLGLLALPAGSAPPAADPPVWLEPRGLSVVEMVGQVPDEVLAGTILSYGDGEGIVVYDAGRLDGDRLVITTTIYPRVLIVPWLPRAEMAQFGCLSQAPHFDHMGTVVAPSTLRLFEDDGEDITAKLLFMTVTGMDLALPLAGSEQPFRYPQTDFGPGRPYPLPLDAQGLHIPASSGCAIGLPDEGYDVLTGVFTLAAGRRSEVRLLGRQQATFHSYIGPGGVGIFQPLMAQLLDRYGSRHERIGLETPPEADFCLVKYPPMPGDPYTDYNQAYQLNAARPSSGTYRLANHSTALSTDLVFSAGWSLGRAWQDTDQVPGSVYLPAFGPLLELAPPEYVLPAGVAYDPCFTRGDCPDELLQEIVDAEMWLEIDYLRVAHPYVDGDWVPVRLAGPAWPAVAAAVSVSETTSATVILLPIVVTQPQDNPSDPPAGWFDAAGRLLDLFPPPTNP